MARISWNIATVKATGQKFVYLYKDAWGQRYYSFDNEQTWHKSKAQAFRHALANDTLAFPREMKDQHFCDSEGGINQ